MTEATDILARIHQRIGEFVAEVTAYHASDDSERLTYNVALSRSDGEAVGNLSYNAATAEEALTKALNDLPS